MSLAVALSSLMFVFAQGGQTTPNSLPLPAAEQPVRPLSFNFDFDANLPEDLLMDRPRSERRSSDEREIVVTAQRFRRVIARASTKRGTNELSCKMRRASGNPSFDTALCAEVTRCIRLTIAYPKIRAMREAGENGRTIRRALEGPTVECVNGVLMQWDERRG